jgi:AbrB family looped-hinge helix DNA binding protein
MRITSKGQVTIPVEIREKAGLLPHTDVEFHYDGDVVTVTRKAADETSRGRQLISHMTRFRPKLTMSTEQVMTLTRGE